MYIARYNNYNTGSQSISNQYAEKPAYIATGSIPADYTDDTSIENWAEHGHITTGDYLFIRDRIIDEVSGSGGFDSLSDSDKGIAAKWIAAPSASVIDDNAIVGYYMSPAGGSMSQGDAVSYYKRTRSSHQHKVKDTCTFRAESEVVNEIVFRYLSTADAGKFVVLIGQLVDTYTRFGIFGKNYGNSEKGILDFIESTNDYNGTGLAEQGYTINSPYVINDLITDLVNWIGHGIKPSWY